MIQVCKVEKCKDFQVFNMRNDSEDFKVKATWESRRKEVDCEMSILIKAKINIPIYRA